MSLRMATSMPKALPGLDDSAAVPKAEQTSCGPLPKDWQEVRIDRLANVVRGASPRPIDDPVWFDDQSSTGWLRISDVTSAGKYLDETTQSLSSAGIAHSRFVKSGNLVMSICATVGRPVITRKDVCIHDGFVVFDGLRADKEYVYYVLSSIEANWSKHGQTGSQMNLNTVLIKSTTVPLPPQREQRTIAAALSDMDGLLEALEALIAKKRAIKHGAMQQLLTGKTRLPGFTGEWETVALDDITTRITGFWGASVSSDRARNPVGVIRAGDISALGALTGFAERYFSDAELEKALCHTNDVVITVSGNGLGKTWLVDGQYHLAASNFVRIVRTKTDRASGRFLASALKGDDAQRLLTEHTATSAYPNLRPSFFSARWLPLPPLDEQTAIATIFSDIDAEIVALERRRDKTRAIKQGMMQQLLTGRVRLVQPAPAAASA